MKEFFDIFYEEDSTIDEELYKEVLLSDTIETMHDNGVYGESGYFYDKRLLINPNVKLKKT